MLRPCTEVYATVSLEELTALRSTHPRRERVPATHLETLLRRCPHDGQRYFTARTVHSVVFISTGACERGRDKVLNSCRATRGAYGVGVVSYSAYSGCDEFRVSV